ncbi:MAG TPA: polyprenyl synthetase family protein [Clostridiaceae bacterium]|nr:polyprenyl synthetase family protein [Clostridiaceae bacterium]
MEIQSQVLKQDRQGLNSVFKKDAALIEKIETELCNELSDSKGPIREMCNHILNSGGKRLRPLLVLYSGMLFSDPCEKLIKAAAAAELIHMASLVHDDVIDNSMLRRNHPSVNCIWGNNFSVLCGDYLFAKAFGILSRYRLIRSMDFMVEAIQNMCHGEILQAEDRFCQEIDTNTYYDRIAKKTAIFLSCCCKSGACVGGGNSVEIDIMGEYGLNIGLAFQIIDDVLDFCGNPDIMGKPKQEDLSQGNITIPVIFLLTSEKYGSWMREIVRRRDFSEHVLNQVYCALLESGAIDDCMKLAESHIEKAKQCLKYLPDSPHKELLYELADALKTRKS